MTLYMVGTPIGNLGDITMRALEVLRKAPIVLVEKWEDSVKLLHHFEIRPPQILKYHDRNFQVMIPKIVELLQTSDVAFITSAGMPGVSDPGAQLVAACYELGIAVAPIPGPSALSTAIAMSGFTGEFLFVEFIPKKEKACGKIFDECVASGHNLVYFESPYRLKKSIEFLNKLYPDARVFVGKEMTKMFERYVTDTPTGILQLITNDDKFQKGEFTVIVNFTM